MRILTLDAALAQCCAAMVANGAVLAQRVAASGRGQAGVLAEQVQAVLAGSGTAPLDLAAVAVTVGPGSFTGLRAALALAHGLAQGIGCPVVGVTVAEAVTAALTPRPGQVIWTAIDSKRGRVFLDTGSGMRATDMADLPRPAGPVLVAGDAAVLVAEWLAARGDDAEASAERLPHPLAIAAVALARLAGRLPPLAAQPLYVDPPEAKLPAGGLRPAPAAP